MNLDDDLRRALRRTSAPPEFADRVLRRIGKSSEDAEGTPSRIQWRTWLATAAAIGLIAIAGTRYYLQQQMVRLKPDTTYEEQTTVRREPDAANDVAEAERIEAEIGLALQITSEKLDLIARKLNDSQP